MKSRHFDHIDLRVKDVERAKKFYVPLLKALGAGRLTVGSDGLYSATEGSRHLMTYYEKLVRNIEKSMNAHPHSTVVMDASTFKILATGQDAGKLARKLRRTKLDQRASVVFKKPDENAVWILPQATS